MASKIKVNTVSDAGDNTIISSDGAGNVTLNASLSGFTSTGIDDNATSTAITIDSSQNLGIGETSPLGLVHIKSADSGISSVSSGADELVLEGSGDTGMCIVSGTSSSSQILFGDSGSSFRGSINYANNDDSLRFTTSASERMRIDSSGNVVIGNVVIEGESVKSKANLNLSADYDNDTSAGFSYMSFSTDGTERARIDFSGRLLVGTTSTTINTSNFGFVFDASTDVLKTSRNVNGGGTSAEHFGNAGQIRFMGDGDAENTNNSYGALSDRTLKENETSANSQWNDIKALQIKNYNLIEYPDRPHLGVIAQDLESAGMNGLVKTYPDILYTEEDDLPEGVSVGDVKEQGHKTVKYSVLYMKAVKCLQEAQTKIETLESTVSDLTTRLEALENV